MNHLRHDKNCLNCGFRVEERYCSKCGQENLEPKESVVHLIGHFFADLTHFDSKLFVTLKDLIIRPGFLTREYVAGRRMAYLNPIRMYVFISAVFFISLFAGGEGAEDHSAIEKEATSVYRRQLADSLRKAGAGVAGTDSLRRVVGMDGLRGVAGTDSLRRVFNASLAEKLDSNKKDSAESLTLSYGTGGKVVIDIVENRYRSVEQYDSLQRTLSDSARDDGMMRWIEHNDIRQRLKHKGEGKLHLEVNIQHDIPKIMFILLPLFAWYVGWFFSRKKYSYVNHAIFSVHFHSFVFLFFIVLLLFGAVFPDDWAGKLLLAFLTRGWASAVLTAMVTLPVFIYLVVALRRMYGQSVLMSILKAVAISLLYFITLAVTSTSLLILALMRI